MPGPESETIVRKVENTPSTLDGTSPEQEADSGLTETVFHGTSVEAARSIRQEGFKPAPHEQGSDPVTWFDIDPTMPSLYGREIRQRDANGVLTIRPSSNPDSTAPSYSVVIEAEIPKSSDPRGFNTTENGIEYIGTTRRVKELGMGNVAITAMRLFEHRRTDDGTFSSSGRLIDEYTFEPNKSLLKRMQEKVRRKKNKIMGRPTL